MQCHFVFGFELGMESLERHLLCVFMSNRRVSMVPTWMLCNLYTYAPYLPKLCGKLLYTCTSPDLSTVRECLLKQTHFKCLAFWELPDEEDAFDTVKVLKCYSGM